MTQNLHFYRHTCCLRLPEVEVLPALGSTPMPCYCQEEADGVGRIFWNVIFNKSELLLMIGRDVTVFVFHIYSQHLFHLLAPREIIVSEGQEICPQEEQWGKESSERLLPEMSLFNVLPSVGKT